MTRRVRWEDWQRERARALRAVVEAREDMPHAYRTKPRTPEEQGAIVRDAAARVRRAFETGRLEVVSERRWRYRGTV